HRRGARPVRARPPDDRRSQLRPRRPLRLGRRRTPRGAARGLMELITRYGDRTEKGRVRRHGDGYEVVVGDRPYQGDAAGQAGTRSLLIEGMQHEVSVRPDGEGWSVTGRHGTAAVSVTDPLTHLANQAQGGKGGKRHRKVAAYMPGRVVAVLVQEGGTVT